MNISNKFFRSLMLVCLLLPSLAHAEKILDRIEIVQTKTEADIHIEFLTQIRYLRHFPTKESSRIQIFLEFPQFAKLPDQREFLNSPPTDIVPSFTVNYPDQATSSIAVKFSKPIKFRVTPDSSGRGLIIHVPLEKPVTPIEPEVKAPPPQPVAEKPVIDVPAIPPGMSVDEYTGKLVGDSRAAIAGGDYAKAIELLNAVLNLPPHKNSQEAQELIGQAREKNGELPKAKAEYELYLKLYPEGEGAARVRQRIVSIDAATKARGIDTAKGKKEIKEIHETSVYGSWDQYYYDAHSHNYNPAPAKNSHSHDQSSLVSSINITGRSRQNQYDSKIVFQNRQTMDFLAGNNHSNRDRTNAAYVEVNNKEVDYLVRLGRQNGNSGGILGRFDGAWLRYGFSPRYRINFVAGTLAEYRVDYNRHFYGINLDIGPLNEKWSGNAFFIKQEVDNVTDRRSVGGELRYFDQGRSIYSLLDYDLLYDRVNIAMVQGNWLTEGGTNFNALIDHRKSPLLQLVNSLSSPAVTTLVPAPTTIRQALRAGFTEPALQDIAVGNTLDTDLFLFGATRQVTPRWQLGGDIRMNRTSGTQGASDAAIALLQKAADEAGTLLDPVTLQNLKNSVGGSGNIWTYTVQAVGTDTLFKKDTSVINASYSTGEISRIQSLILSNVAVPTEKWRVDTSLKLMRVDSDPSVLTRVISPTVRVGYRLREKATLEAEVGLEWANTDDSINGDSRTFRDFSFIGYRLDI